MEIDPTGPGMVVPIDVAAFCVGTVDAHGPTQAMAGATVVYTNMVTNSNAAFLGENIFIDYAKPAWQNLQTGVHLHWALPDALTKATVQQGNLAFKPAPNRWLVTRFAFQSTTPTVSSWVVESDILSTSAPSGQQPVTLPVTPASPTDQNYRYLGLWQEYSASYTPTVVPAGQSIAELAGSELTAVSTGVPNFAAYYPNSCSTFGFYDTLTDLVITDNTPVPLAYVVTGWYENPANDPVSARLTTEGLRSQHKWSVTSDTPPSYTLYNGFIQEIAWNPNTAYVPMSPPAISADVAVGNNPAEALSAYIRAVDGPNNDLYEQLLTAFQFDLLSKFTQPAPGQYADLLEALHEQQFSAVNAGTIYAVVSADPEKNDGQNEEIELPIPLADALNLLNIYQQQLDLAAADMSAYQYELFADWYRIFAANESDVQNVAFLLAEHRYGNWATITQAYTAIQTNVNNQLLVVQGMLDSSLQLKSTPAPRYWQPSEPALLLASADLAPAVRYGGDGRFTADDTLECRSTTQLLTTETVNGVTIAASQFSSYAIPVPSNLTYGDECNELIFEFCLLCPRLLSPLVNDTQAILTTALQAALGGQNQTVFVFPAPEVLPSLVGVNWWTQPWLPIVAAWTVSLLPLQSTVTQGQMLTYNPEFFTANYTIDPSNGASIAYTPGTGSGSINIDPAQASFTPTYSGSAIITTSAASRFEKKLADYLETHQDASLQAALTTLQSTNILMQALSGFANALMMRQQTIQLSIQAPANSSYAQITDYIAPIVGNQNTLSPEFNGYFNPIRAGWMQLSVVVVDAFGQKRSVQFSPLICSETMTTTVSGATVPSIASLEPRLAQPARLLFRWIAADSSGLDEMNSHPATTPICGWFMPNLIDGSLFVYGESGSPLGTVGLNGNQTQVLWQSAPGDNATIDDDAATALQYANPQLTSVVLSLVNGTAAFFLSFWQAIDTANSSILPPGWSTGSGLAVLVGRPVALVQASLRLELQGAPALNESWYLFTGSDYAGDTDSGTTQVNFPVVLGNLQQMSDGLVGYYKQPLGGDAYDLTTFYSEAASPTSQSGVVQPDSTNIVLTATPKVDPTDPGQFADYTQMVLMLVDPRAGVHATTGILPTKAIEIPADLYTSAVGNLEMTFLTAPILWSNGGLVLPLPGENGYQISWVEEDDNSSGTPEWSVTPDIGSPAGLGVWAYTPQQIAEGWLRLNPVVLEFSLLNSANAPVVTQGATVSLNLVVTNKRGTSITFIPGQLIGEGETNTGSIFYLHLGDLVSQTNIPNIQLAADDWTFACLSSTKYGAYWAATPAVGTIVTLENGASFTITVGNLTVTTTGSAAEVYVDYYNLDGASDGVYEQTLTVQTQQASAAGVS